MTPFDAANSHGRAIRQLNEVYFEFVQSLEPPLDQLALSPTTFSQHQHTGTERQFVCLEDLALLDISLPLMLAEAFSLPQDTLLAIASSGVFALFAVLLYDAMFDGQIPAHPDRLLLQNLLYAKALSYWFALFGQDSPFWHYHRAYFGEYFRAISAERNQHCKLISTYGKAQLCQIARGKSAPRKVLLAAMAIRDGKDVPERIAALSASLDAYAIADQILDDVSDWEEDFSNRRFSYLLTQVIISHGLESRIDMEARPSPLEIIEMAMHVFGSGEPQALLDEAHGWFEEAIRCVDEIACPEWKQFVRNRAGTCVETKRRIEALIVAATRWFGDR